MNLLEATRKKTNIYFDYPVIYKFIFPNNKFYIGQAIKFGKRMCGHVRTSKYSVEEYKKLCPNSIKTICDKAISKYGPENINVEILFLISETMSKDDIKIILNENEKYYISYFNSTDKNIGYNISSGGLGGCGCIHSEESKRIVGEKTKQRYLENPDSFSWYKRHPGEKHPNAGRIVSKEAREKISKATSGPNNPMYGIPRPEGGGKPSIKIDVCFFNGEIEQSFDSISDAERFYKTKKDAIAKQIRENKMWFNLKPRTQDTEFKRKIKLRT